MQLLAYIHTQQQSDGGGERSAPLDSLEMLLAPARSTALTDFIKSAVSIHSIVTARIDQLLPNQQLTLKVGQRLSIREGESVLPAS